MDTKEKIIQILKEIKPAKNLQDIEDIVEGGYIDSFELMMLITSLSEKFQVEIGIDDMTAENFNSVKAMAEMIDRLVSAK
ncbi:MAG: acyl carrier protein [Lachnospiraceae bacterium]|nr:acyl carrier protein [Lachnospiraceae bacterium]